MVAYALGRLEARNSRPHPDVIEYIERIQATLDPYGGAFLVHGVPVEVREGAWAGGLVLIGFPGMAEARAWYDSPDYQEIIPLRTDHITGDIVLVEGVPSGYDPRELADKMRSGS
ncbi:DUF1330 domain-containing protein [Streptomyces sp. SCA3-4]|uniref:DUF1330 domain-containing protein n=1 Tax=Streptomyces sichuanensis TaxID=2871810 RepID=UPI001CE26D47|nr:DUF1330 domain-containing protein [Streptomyces sichuanensis]MCA6091902.1 DUF1330 domain-containing protein [Streptomyces sichuanensis]